MAKEKLGIAIDIGTTTLAGVLTDAQGSSLAENVCANSASRYGSDVMSRIRAATGGRSREIQSCMQKDLTAMIHGLLFGSRTADSERAAGSGSETTAEGKAPVSVDAIVLAGNTTMLHLLCGYDCSGLGQYPYTPVTTAWEERSAGGLLPDLSAEVRDARVFLLPGISAFVGADIVAGLYACGLGKLVLKNHTFTAGSVPDRFPDSGIRPDQTTLFLDLGTNGEMALIVPDDEKAESLEAGAVRITVCSTAAGPVFEGAGIRDGMRGTPGAVSSVVLVPQAETDSGAKENAAGIPMSGAAVTARCRTIAHAPAAGICGSGVLEAVSELVRVHLIDGDGLLAEPWFTEGFPLAVRQDGTRIRIFREDIRSVQLAKAAIRAGMEALPLACGRTARDIDCVLVAGAFGGALSFSRLAPLGMFPPSLTGRARAVGNTSLKGAVRAAAGILIGNGEDIRLETTAIAAAAQELPLAGRQDFEACYLAMMGFRSL